MRKLITILVVVLLFSCNKNSSSGGDGMTPILPASATLEPYDDGTGIIRVTTYATDGSILEQGDYVNGLREGVYTIFYPNGFVQSTMGYVHGKKQGQFVSLDDKGQVLERSTYHNDELNGPHTVYNRNRIKESTSYVNGKLSGQVEKFYPNGNIMERSNYKEGTLDGVARWYDQEGNVSIEYTYKMGELVNDGTSAPE